MKKLIAASGQDQVKSDVWTQISDFRDYNEPKMLVLDLDNTLIHCMNGPVQGAHEINVGNRKVYFFSRPGVGRLLNWLKENNVLTGVFSRNKNAIQIAEYLFSRVGAGEIYFGTVQTRHAKKVDMLRHHFPWINNQIKVWMLDDMPLGFEKDGPRQQNHFGDDVQKGELKYIQVPEFNFKKMNVRNDSFLVEVVACLGRASRLPEVRPKSVGEERDEMEQRILDLFSCVSMARNWERIPTKGLSEVWARQIIHDFKKYAGGEVDEAELFKRGATFGELYRCLGGIIKK